MTEPAIDEKVKPIPERCKAGLAKLHEGLPLAGKNKEQIAQQVLTRYEAGETMLEIAQSYGLKGSEQLYRLLLATSPEQWKEYQASKVLKRLDDANKALEIASDALSLARAREQVRSAQWELERVLKRIYGTDQPSNPGGQVVIHIGIDRDAATHNVTLDQIQDNQPT